MPRFVVLRHQTPPEHVRPLHWDFMVQCGDELRVWALREVPRPDDDIPAEALAAHRPFYLDHEGAVPGNRGHVTRWDHGTFRWLADEESSVRIDLVGQKMIGRVTLTRCEESWWNFRYSVG